MLNQNQINRIKEVIPTTDQWLEIGHYGSYVAKNHEAAVAKGVILGVVSTYKAIANKEFDECIKDLKPCFPDHVYKSFIPEPWRASFIKYGIIYDENPFVKLRKELSEGVKINLRENEGYYMQSGRNYGLPEYAMILHEQDSSWFNEAVIFDVYDTQYSVYKIDWTLVLAFGSENPNNESYDRELMNNDLTIGNYLVLWTTEDGFNRYAIRNPEHYENWKSQIEEDVENNSEE